MKRSLLLIATAALLMVSCRQQSTVESFCIEGTVTEAEGKTIYLDHLGVALVQTVDSAKLDADGHFSFRQPRPDCYDFYRLRIDRQLITLAVDSTETISVTAKLPNMSTSYLVEGSNSCIALKKLIIRQMELQREIDGMVKSYGLQTGLLSQKVNETVDLFKSEIAEDFIYKDMESPSAYYALFMRINGTPLFRPQESRQDAKYFASVATVMDMKNPDAVRVQNLHNVALKGMKATTKAVRNDNSEASEYLSSIITESGVIEIELPDASGAKHRLSDLKGKVVLLDFTAFMTDYSVDYTMMLRALYSKYAEQGFEIYQVSVDSDRHFWITSTDNLPWICVNDENSFSSEYLTSYRVETLPTAFLINRNNEIVERMQSYQDLDSHIAALLKD